jgi:hypothetical protein
MLANARKLETLPYDVPLAIMLSLEDRFATTFVPDCVIFFVLSLERDFRS